MGTFYDPRGGPLPQYLAVGLSGRIGHALDDGPTALAFVNIAQQRDRRLSEGSAQKSPFR